MGRIFKIKHPLAIVGYSLLALSLVLCPVCFSSHATAAPVANCHQSRDSGSSSDSPISGTGCDYGNSCLSVALPQSIDSSIPVAYSSAVFPLTFSQDVSFAQSGVEFSRLYTPSPAVTKVPIRIINSVFRL